jgi:hypothetical protein
MEKIREKLEKIQEIVREGFPSYPLMTGEAVWQLATEALALIDEKEKEKSKKIPMGAGNVLWEEASTKGEPNG